MGIADALDTDTNTGCTIRSSVVQDGIVAGSNTGNVYSYASNRCSAALCTVFYVKTEILSFEQGVMLPTC